MAARTTPNRVLSQQKNAFLRRSIGLSFRSLDSSSGTGLGFDRQPVLLRGSLPKASPEVFACRLFCSQSVGRGSLVRLGLS